jgi:hypothetical protein
VAVDQSVYFACGLRATELRSISVTAVAIGRVGYQYLLVSLTCNTYGVFFEYNGVIIYVEVVVCTISNMTSIFRPGTAAEPTTEIELTISCR